MVASVYHTSLAAAAREGSEDTDGRAGSRSTPVSNTSDEVASCPFEIPARDRAKFAVGLIDAVSLDTSAVCRVSFNLEAPGSETAS
jgi:hypothetical protein